MLHFVALLQAWGTLKARLSRKNKNILFKEGQIWWCHLGMNLGEEEYGKGPNFTRPILILKKFTKNSFSAVPLTSQPKVGSWYTRIDFHNRSSWALLNQVKTLDKKRLISHIAQLKDADFCKTKERYINLYRS